MTTPKHYEHIRDSICKISGITVDEFEGKCRKRYLVNARQLFCHYMCLHSKLSLCKIGEMIGNRDHTTVIHSREQAKALILTDDEFRGYWNSIQIALTYIPFTSLSYKPKIETP